MGIVVHGLIFWGLKKDIDPSGVANALDDWSLFGAMFLD
jgi:hypothetical protein